MSSRRRDSRKAWSSSTTKTMGRSELIESPWRWSPFIADSHAQGRPDGVDQSIAAERLSEEAARAGLEGLSARLFIAVRGQNDNRDPRARDGQVSEQVKALHPGHPQIEHKTTGGRSMGGLQERLSGGERLHLEADRRQKIPDGPAQ